MTNSNWQHVFPLNEEAQHKLNGFGTECECDPKVDWDNQIAVHNSFDGREAVEMANKILDAEVKKFTL